jgi:hypothetical protein
MVRNEDILAIADYDEGDRISSSARDVTTVFIRFCAIDVSSKTKTKSKRALSMFTLGQNGVQIRFLRKILSSFYGQNYAGGIVSCSIKICARARNLSGSSFVPVAACRLHVISSSESLHQLFVRASYKLIRDESGKGGML